MYTFCVLSLPEKKNMCVRAACEVSKFQELEFIHFFAFQKQKPKNDENTNKTTTRDGEVFLLTFLYLEFLFLFLFISHSCTYVKKASQASKFCTIIILLFLRIYVYNIFKKKKPWPSRKRVNIHLFTTSETDDKLCFFMKRCLFIHTYVMCASRSARAVTRRPVVVCMV